MTPVDETNPFHTVERDNMSANSRMLHDSGSIRINFASIPNRPLRLTPGVYDE